MPASQKSSSHHSTMTIIPASDLSCFSLTGYVSSLEGFALINCFRLMWGTFKSLEISLWKILCKAAYPKWLHSKVWNLNLIYRKWPATRRCRTYFFNILNRIQGERDWFFNSHIMHMDLFKKFTINKGNTSQIVIRIICITFESDTVRFDMS